MYYVYILLLNNKDLYKGSTSDLRVRLRDHQNGKVESTRNFRPLKLVHYEGFVMKSDAERRERFLKTTEGRRLLRQQIRDILEKLNNKTEG